MKNKTIIICWAVLLASTIPFSLYASENATTTISIRIETATTTLIDSQIEVIACSPNETGTTTLTGYCAIKATGLNNAWSSYGDDYFLEGIQGATNDFVSNTYWSWFSNESYGQTALTGHTLAPHEHLLLTLGIMPLKIEVSTTTATVSEFGFDDSWNGVWLPSASSTVYSDSESICTTSSLGLCTLTASTSDLVLYAVKSHFATSTSKIFAKTDTITAPDPTPTETGSGGSSSPTPPPQKSVDGAGAVSFLYSKQQSDGSFSNDLYTDWAALALSGTGETEQKRNLTAFILTKSPHPSSVTDYERHAMVLMAYGINPYSGTSINYISPIIEAFDGEQIGEKGLINDDIFALFPLLKVGYSTSDSMIETIALHIIRSQKENGSWNDSIDMTAAAIQALSQVQAVTGTPTALSKAKNYIVNKQESDGGFGSVFSTAWVIQAIHALGEDPLTTKNNAGKNPLDSLAGLQAPDGGFEFESSAGTRIWSTSYALSGILGRTWSSLLSSFSKQEIPVTNTVPPASTNTQESTSTINVLPKEILKIETEEVKEYTRPLVQKAATVVTKTEPVKESVAEIQNPLSEETPVVLQSLASVGASNPPTPLTEIALKISLSIVALSGVSLVFFKI